MPIELPVQCLGGVVWWMWEAGMGWYTGELVDVLVAEAGRLAL